MVPAGQSVRMVAFGGGLTAGVMNGGLYREGQQLAYPNLVAHQLGLTDFHSPLFAEHEANGTGFLLPSRTHQGEFPRWQRVSNQLAAEAPGSPASISPYAGEVRNYAVPSGQPETPLSKSWDHGHYSFQPYLWRIIPREVNATQSPLEYAQQHTPYNFVLYEDYFDNWIRGMLRIPNFNMWDFYGITLSLGQQAIFRDSNIDNLFYEGAKGVLFTIPRYQDLAYMQWYSLEKGNQQVQEFVRKYRSTDHNDPSRPTYFLATTDVDRLFRGLSATLPDSAVITSFEETLSDPEWEYGHNKRIRAVAAQRNLALVDLSAIYAQIRQGIYVTDDGLKIDGSPRGNFFSSDGIYPSPIGHAVIANEVIKAINRTYQAKIPLIHVGEFANAINLKP
ncbi:hypothetical protein GCM10027275_07430 [Rhabdobacter roseus]